MWWKALTRFISKTSKFSTSQDQYSKVLKSLYLLYAKLKAIQIYRNYAPGHFLLPHIKCFQEIKEVWTTLLASFST